MAEATGAKRQALHTPARVLIVIDQPLLAEVVKLALNHGVFIPRVAPDVSQATESLRTWQPHMAIVDMDISRGGLLGELGETVPGANRTPIVALTRRGDLRTTLAAFDWGVDDLLTVPFPPEELLARTLAVMRRTYRATISFTPTIRLGELEIDILNRRVRAGESELHLTPLEQNLLYLLAANAGRLLTRDEILDSLWGVDYVADSNVVDRHVRNLRAKLQNDSRRPRYIATVPGRGYRFIPTDTGEGPTLPTS
ncbi:MAG TPA: response regulator transcription factor [Chloroflexota bacterium]|nr:response regulator transcription factor [Chloroflexota bacterium]